MIVQAEDAARRLTAGAQARRRALMRGGRHDIASLTPTRLVRGATTLLVVAIAVLLTGIERYFAFWLPPLHYAFDAVVVACIVVVLSDRDAPLSVTRSTWPYLVFVTAYIAWGVAVSRDAAAIAAPATSGLLLNLLVVLAVAVTLRNRHTVRRVASAAQVAALVTFAMGLYELTQPGLVTRLALTQDPHTLGYNEARPSGFWAQANDGGAALVLMFFLSHWAGPRLRWAGRLAALGGVYLSGSREALYPLVGVSICMAVRSAIAPRPARRHRSWRRALVPLTALTAMGIITVALVATTGDRTLQRDMLRFADFTQGDQNPSLDPSRAYLLVLWLPRALSGPWFGGGLFSFQGTSRFVGALGSHDVYLTIWGEAGLAMLILYGCVILWGVRRGLTLAPPGLDRLLIGLMWIDWVLHGLVSHSLMFDVATLLFIAVLLCLPGALATSEGAAPAAARPGAAVERPGPHRGRTRTAGNPGPRPAATAATATAVARQHP